MSKLELFRRRSLLEVARELDIHPFDICRYYGQTDVGLRSELAFRPSELETLRDALGLENWWAVWLATHQGSTPDQLVSQLADFLLKMDALGTSFTRVDNLFRGLVGENNRTMRMVVNELIQLRVLSTTSSSTGLMVSLVSEDGDRRTHDMLKDLKAGKLHPQIRAVLALAESAGSVDQVPVS